MIIKKMVGIFDNLEDFHSYIKTYKSTDWTLLAEHMYMHPFKGEYAYTYIVIYVKELEEEVKE